VNLAPALSGRVDGNGNEYALIACLDASLADIKRLAQQCDKLCFAAGAHLSEAVPGLSNLSSHFEALSTMLEGEDVSAATANLEQVARDVEAIGHGLTAEHESLGALIVLNHLLSRHIANLDDDVRFLAAVVSYVKIELAAIDHEGERLEGFSQSLEELAFRTQSTLDKFQATHTTLLYQLQQTAGAQSSFVTSHQAKLVDVAQEIETSLSILSTRRKTISGVAAEIGTTAQNIGMRIAQSVVALQIGDSARQRIEHAGEALTVAADFFRGGEGSALFSAFDGEPSSDDRRMALVRVCDLQSLQLAGTASEFSPEMATIKSLLAQIVDSVGGLSKRSDDLFGSQDPSSNSFLGDLEQKLETARQLIDQCEQSRTTVDKTAAEVVLTIVELERLAVNVAAMAIDMTIIGTNAIVAAHRLGTRGAALSVIAQHLRGHAIGVADGVKLLKPALADVLTSANHFVEARKGQDAESMAVLAASMNAALGSFKTCAAALSDLRQRLGHESAVAEGLLRQAMTGLGEVDNVDEELGDAAAAVGRISAEIDDGQEASTVLDETLDRLLRPKYTMASERTLHDTFFSNGGGGAGATLPAAEADLDCLF